MEGDGDAVLALATWEGEVISRHESGRIRVWDVESGQRLRELEGNNDCVLALLVCGSLLASG